MKIYIATKFENQTQFHQLALILKAMGHKIVLDWTKHSLKGVPEDEVDAYKAKCAAECYLGVSMADALIFLGDRRKMAGSFVELGIALGQCKRIVMVNTDVAQSCIFFSLPQLPGIVDYAESVEHAIDLIGPAMDPSNN
jgi:hypothetical protein